MYQQPPYLNNTKAPMELLGISQLLSPFGDKLSSQRGMMFASHLTQSQVMHGCEHPLIFTGFESIVGEYEFNTTERNQDIQILEVIPKYITDSGTQVIKDNPLWTIIYRGDRDKQIGYFNLEKHTIRSDGYGYQNKWLNINQLNKGNFIPREMPLCTSPAHDGPKYALGTNLNVAYMDLPGVTEDAFIISERAAKKMATDGYGRISFKIGANQIPLNLYGDSMDNYKFLPDIGEKVNKDCVLCALRTPSAESVLTDMTEWGLKKIQHLHDTKFYVPEDAEVVDIEVHINQKCKVKTPKEVFVQAQKYRDHINKYYLKIWDVYRDILATGKEISPAFSTLVTRAVSSLLADNVRIPGYVKKSNVTLVKKKEVIEFIYITVTYKYINKVKKGFKCTNAYGGKGVVSQILPDDEMPIDDFGNQADIVGSPIAVFNRMNPAQSYVQFFNAASLVVINKMRMFFLSNDPKAYEKAFALLIEYTGDINKNWSNLLVEKYNNIPLQKGLIDATINEGTLYLNVPPYLDGINEQTVLAICKKYGVTKTPVNFTITKSDGTKLKKRSKGPILIGSAYWFMLFKIPKLRSCSHSYINQYRTPSKPGNHLKHQSYYITTPIRVGEDENRYIVRVMGGENTARFIGAYANTTSAVNQLGHHLLFDKVPSVLEQIEMSTRDVLDGNTIIGVTKHIFSCIGIDISPKNAPDVEYMQIALPETTEGN